MKEFVDNNYGRRKAEFFRDQVVSNAKAAMIKTRDEAISNPEIFADTPMAWNGTQVYNGMKSGDILAMYDNKQTAYDSINPFNILNGALTTEMMWANDHAARYKQSPTYKAKLFNGDKETRKGDVTAMGYYPQDWFACGGVKKMYTGGFPIEYRYITPVDFYPIDMAPIEQPHINVDRSLSYPAPKTDIETMVGKSFHNDIMANHPTLSGGYDIIGNGVDASDEYGPYEKDHLYLKGDWQTRGIIDTTQWDKNKIVENGNRRKLVLKNKGNRMACGGMKKAALGTITPDDIVIDAGTLPEATSTYESPVDIGLQSLKQGERDPRLQKFVVKEDSGVKIDPGYMASQAAWNGLMFAGNFAEKMRNDKNKLASVAANLNNTQTPVMAMRGYDPTVNPTHLGYDADPSRLSQLYTYKCGGRKYALGGVYDLTAKEIDEILNNGGKIEYLW